MIKWPEPVAHMWQHDETGRVGFVEASQSLDQWTKANPRLAIVAKVHTEAQLKLAVRDAVEMCARASDCRDLPATSAAIRALIKEIE